MYFFKSIRNHYIGRLHFEILLYNPRIPIPSDIINSSNSVEEERERSPWLQDSNLDF